MKVCRSLFTGVCHIVFATLTAALINAAWTVAVVAQPGPPRTMTVDVAPVKLSAMNSDLRAVGSLNANEAVIIRPEIAGRVKSIEFKEGQPVKQGAVLFTLSAVEYEAEVAQSAAQAKLNELIYKRATDLKDRKLVSQQEYDESLAKWEESQAKVALDESRLEKTIVRAPFSGIVGVRKVSVGAYVKAGDDIVSLEDIDPLKVDFRVPEIYIPRIKPGQSLNVTVDAYPNEQFSGQLYAIDPSIDPQTRTLLLRGRVANSQGKLRPGMFAKVNLISNMQEQALLIPEQALVPIGNEQFVFRLQDGKAVKTKVAVKRRLAGEVEIAQGLTLQDQVLIAGQTKVKDGMPVKVAGQQPATPK